MDFEDTDVMNDEFIDICTQLPADERSSFFDDAGLDGGSSSIPLVTNAKFDTGEPKSVGEDDADDDDDERQFLAAWSDRLWENGKNLSVRFLDGTPDIHDQVKRYASIWEQYANIKFNFITSGPAEIRVSFRKDLGAFSRVGKDVLACLEPKRTMNLPIDSSNSDREICRYVLHEFGHALGCVHEHSSPSRSFQWNEDAVRRYYNKRGWNNEKIDKNIFRRYDKKTVSQYSEFDPHSIMIYRIPEKLTDGFSVGWNTTLSAKDKEFIAEVYPKPIHTRNHWPRVETVRTVDRLIRAREAGQQHRS